MSHQDFIVSLTSCLVLSSFCAVRADSVETTETTVTRTSNVSDSIQPISLPATGNYLVVDPFTGMLKGRYDPVAGMVDGRTLQSGLVIVDKPSGNLVAIIDPSGRAVDLNAAPASDVFMVSIDSRRKDLERQYALALNRGQLTATEVSSLRAELDRIAAEQAATASGNSYSYRRALVVASDLNNLSQRLYPAAVTTPVIAPQFVVLNKQVTMVDPITSRKMQLLNRIEDEYQAGRLSSDNVSDLKGRMDRISSQETRYRRDGELSDSKLTALSIKLDQLETVLGEDVANVNEKRARIGIKVN